MSGHSIAQNSTPTSSLPHRLKAIHISVSFSGTYFLVLVVSLLFVAYQFAQSNAYYFSLCLLSVSLVSLAHALYQTGRLRVRLPSSILVAANTPFVIPVNLSTALSNVECALPGTPWLNLSPASREGRYQVGVPPQVRGEYRLDSIRVRRSCALGVFFISKTFMLDSKVYVYPAAQENKARDERADQESLDLHPYRAGDAVHRIDWRGAARGRELYCYRSNEQQAQDVYLSLNTQAPLEAELSRLASEVIARGEGFTSFGLHLGSINVAAGQGQAHVTRCLQQLAAYAAKNQNLLTIGEQPSPPSTPSDRNDESPANKGLLFLCALASLSVYIPDPLWLPLSFCLAALLWRLWRGPLSTSWRNQFILSLLVIAGAAYQCFYLSSVFSFYTAVSYLTLALASKLLFFKPRRDALATVSLFCLISCMAFYHSDQPFQVLLSLTTLFSGMLYILSVQQADLSGYRISALLSTAIVLASCSFALFPAPQQALWQSPFAAQGTSIGLGDEISPGSMSSLSKDQRVVFRAYLSPSLSRLSEFFWRTSVFDDFDGRTWRHGNAASFLFVVANNQSQSTQTTADYSYTLKFDALQDNRLYRLDIGDFGTQLDIDHIESEQGEFYLARATQPLRQYSVFLTKPAVATAPVKSLDEEQRKHFLRLPPYAALKTRQLVAAWVDQLGGKAQARQIKTKALAFFAKGGFQYSTENVRIEGDLVDGFVFGERKGYCEHYASAFAVMMRAAGIPARVASGYAGADSQANGDYYLVRQSFAHAWAEIWIDGQGWQRVDPTAYVSDFEAQRQPASSLITALAEKLSLSLAWFQQLNSALLLAFMLVFVGILLLLPWLRRALIALRVLPRAPLNPANALELAAADCFRQLVKRCRRYGIAVSDSDDIESCADKICTKHPELKPVIGEFAHIYNLLRYSRHRAWWQLQRLQILLNHIKL